MTSNYQQLESFARAEILLVQKGLNNDGHNINTDILRRRRRGSLIESSQYCPSCPARVFLSARNRENRLCVGAKSHRDNSIMNMTVHHAQRVSYPVPTAVNVPERE